jgi:hypothetical protein
MNVKGKTTTHNVVEGSFTKNELEQLIRNTLALPRDAALELFAELPSIDDTELTIDDDHPIRFRAFWQQTAQGPDTHIPAITVVERARGGSPLPKDDTDPRGEPLYPNAAAKPR